MVSSSRFSTTCDQMGAENLPKDILEETERQHSHNFYYSMFFITVILS